MIDYSQILTVNYADKQWALNGNSYEGLTWLDSSPKPTKDELDALWQATQEQAVKNACKEKAKALLAASDWSVLPDVSLTNKDAFAFYRLNLRNLVLNPVVDPVWEDEPKPIWG